MVYIFFLSQCVCGIAKDVMYRHISRFFVLASSSAFQKDGRKSSDSIDGIDSIHATPDMV